jgi:hypothetical protein
VLDLFKKKVLELNISWNFSGTSKLLGMGFDLSQNDKTVKHFTDKNTKKYSALKNGLILKK